VGSYEEIRTRRTDFLYLDPRYEQKKPTMYCGRIEEDHFFRWLGGQRARYVLSLSGYVDGEDCRVDVPPWHFDEHAQVDAGLRQVGDNLAKSQFAKVTDSLHIRREA
jgi:hypothetical protein